MDAADWNARYADTELVWSAGPNRFLETEVTGLQPGRALDLACGEGRNAIWLAGRGWDVVAVDFSRVAIDKARRLAAAREVEVSWVEADVRDYAPDPGAFDLVAILYLHLQQADLRRVLQTAVGGLAPGGTMLLVGHDLENLDHGHGGPQDPEILWTPETITGALAGLEVERAERVLRPVTTEHGAIDAVDTLVRARR